MPVTTVPVALTSLSRPFDTFRFTCPANGSEDTLSFPVAYAWAKFKNLGAVDIVFSVNGEELSSWPLAPGETSDWIPMVDEEGNAVVLTWESTTAATASVSGMAAQAPSLGLAR